MRILLIEDDAVLQTVMLRSLSDAGHRVDAASHLEEGAHFWQVHRLSFSANTSDWNPRHNPAQILAFLCFLCLHCICVVSV